MAFTSFPYRIGKSEKRVPAWLTSGMLGIAILCLGSLLSPGHAESSDIIGSWSGGGFVSYATGDRERARCKVRYEAKDENSYVMSGTCATASGNASQSAVLKRTSAHTYVGTFFNSDYNISGRIRVSVEGNTQNAVLTSDGGSATLSLRR